MARTEQLAVPYGRIRSANGNVITCLIVPIGTSVRHKQTNELDGNKISGNKCSSGRIVICIHCPIALHTRVNLEHNKQLADNYQIK